MECESFWPTTRAELPPISDSELEYLFMIDKEEILWKASQPKLHFVELINIYALGCVDPNKTEKENKKLKAYTGKNRALRVAKKTEKLKLKYFKKRITEINNFQEDYLENRIYKMPWQEQNDFKEGSDKDFDEARRLIESEIAKTNMNLYYFDELGGKKPPKQFGGISPSDVLRAKEILITNFIQVDHSGFAKCPFHNETSASFKFYKDQNSWWCYSCQTGGSVVDFVMKQQNVDFLTAVKFLLK